MQNSIAAGRRLALRVVSAQVVATAIVAAGFAFTGWRSGLGVLAGGGTGAVGTAMLALRMFAAGPSTAGTALARMIVGNLLKWIVIGGGLYLVLAKAGLPGGSVIAGVIAALLPQLLGLHEGWARS